ncbi:MAG: UDP-4-amino-4,6-dideoxy-N-acetyl-beta-L-altrosamine transaminase [Deltaproteobacteria bacterium]|nr:UDP-4-amino-4,6-dideoxy-N-acetyl-beta-L-altrosamine transaminase [Deltaproteobacteria bacterium]
MIPYGRQSIDDDDIEAVEAVLRSDWLTQGPAIARFETAVAQAAAVPFAVAVSSATAALHLACLAMDVGPGDMVWTSPNTFVASANCARYCGARVDFVDIDPATLNMSVAALADKLERTQRSGGLMPKLVIPVHFAGQSCPMAEFAALADRYGFRLLEDASHAIGASYKGAPVGNCNHSDATIFSFHPVKIVTTGEGGVVVTKSQALFERLLRLRTHGITRERALMQGESHGPWYYQQVELGFNYRMTDIQAALGASQMHRLQTFVTRRRVLVERYRAALAHTLVHVQGVHSDADPSWHLFVVRVPAAQRREIFESLRAADIGVNVHYIPVHTQPDFMALGFRDGMFPEAERYYAEAISMPLYASLSFAEQDVCIAALKEAIKESGA